MASKAYFWAASAELPVTSCAFFFDGSPRFSGVPMMRDDSIKIGKKVVASPGYIWSERFVARGVEPFAMLQFQLDFRSCSGDRTEDRPDKRYYPYLLVA